MNNFIAGSQIWLAGEFDNRFMNTSNPNSQNGKCRKHFLERSAHSHKVSRDPICVDKVKPNFGFEALSGDEIIQNQIYESMSTHPDNYLLLFNFFFH